MLTGGTPNLLISYKINNSLVRILERFLPQRGRIITIL